MREVVELFEQELKKRRIDFEIDPDSSRYRLQHGGFILLVSLDNLAREFQRNSDGTRVVQFVDAILSRRMPLPAWAEARREIYLSFEPSDQVEPPKIRKPLSDLVDQVPVHFSRERGALAWIEHPMLEAWGASEAEVCAEGIANLARSLEAGKVEHWEIDNVRLGSLATTLPFKSALLLAPNLRTVVEPILGWPLYAVIPDRDFMYLWDARHDDFIGRVGHVVVEEFRKAPYPLSPEIFLISDDGISAIGAFSVPADD